jgi:hypothetical protein
MRAHDFEFGEHASDDHHLLRVELGVGGVMRDSGRRRQQRRGQSSGSEQRFHGHRPLDSCAIIDQLPW